MRFTSWVVASVCAIALFSTGGCFHESKAKLNAEAISRDHFQSRPTTAPTVDLAEFEEETAAQPEMEHEAVAARSPAAEATLAARAQKRHLITINKSFLNTYRNRATITTSFHVFDIKPHEDDGDIHVSGYADKMVLAGVAEIINGAEHQDVVHSMDVASQPKVTVTGVWRFWCEHPGFGADVQGGATPKPQSGTYHHVFEIHPVTKIGHSDVADSFHPIPKPPNKYSSDARTNFGEYQKLTCKLSADTKKITIDTTEIGFNYPEFFLSLTEPLKPLDDGGMQASGQAFDKQGSELAECRMIFAPGTDVLSQAQQWSTGEKHHVLGLVRMDLDIIAARAATNSHTNDALPYEIVIVGVYP